VREGARPDAGQATVELALALPVVAVAALLVVQVGLVVRAQILTIHAAREGARAASVDSPPNAVALAARAPGLDPNRLDVAATRSDDLRLVRVVVRYRAATDVPLIGAALPDVILRSEATMQVERPGQ
jgi:hypothetical protein